MFYIIAEIVASAAKKVYRAGANLVVLLLCITKLNFFSIDPEKIFG